MAFTLLVTREQRTIDTLEFASDPESVSVGREEECDVRLESLNVSRRHCEVISRGGLQLVRDLGSSNGTFVNGQRVTEHTLNPGDIISVGEYTLRYDAIRVVAPVAPSVLAADGALLTIQVAKPEAQKVSAPRAVAHPVSHLVLLPPAEPRTVLVRGATFLIGAAPNADLRLTSPRAPRVAAVLVRDGDDLLLVDLSPRRDAVKVAGIPALETKLPPETSLEIAGTKLLFRRGLPQVEASRTTARYQRP